MRLMYRQRGISLLELILVISVVASMVLLSIRYFWAADRQAQVYRAIKQVDRVVAASYQWQASQRQSNFSEINSATLVEGGWLLKSDETNPWGGEVEVGSVKGEDGVLITLKGLSVSSASKVSLCPLLLRQLQGVAVNKETVTCVGDAFSGVF